MIQKISCHEKNWHMKNNEAQSFIGKPKLQNVDLLIVYGRGLDAIEWFKQHKLGKVPNALPYGFEHLEKWVRAIFVNRQPNIVIDYLDRIGKHSIGFEILHPLQSLAVNKNANVVITMADTYGVALGWLRYHHFLRTDRYIHLHIAVFLSQMLQGMSSRQLRVVRKALGSVDGVVYLSQNQRPILKEFLDLPDNKLFFVPYGIDSDFFSPRKLTEHDNVEISNEFILSVGGDAGRDYRALLEAMKHCDETLLLVCRPWNKVWLRQVPKNVQVRVDVPHTELRTLYHKAKFVVVSLKKNWTYPSGSTVLLEAMAMGKAVIISRIPGIMSYVQNEKTALLVKPEAVSDLIGAIQHLSQNHEERKRIEKRARLVVEREYDVNIWAYRLAEVINRCLIERGGWGFS